MPAIDITLALETARKAASVGANIALTHRASGKALRVDVKDVTDFVTEVDHASQEAMVGTIRSAFPEHRFLAEEPGADAWGDPASAYRWIIDPLDGTKPFIHGKSSFGAIVALQENDRTILGVMVLPELHEEFWAVKGQGAYSNGAKIQSLRKTAGMIDAIICTNTVQDYGSTDPVVTLRFPRCSSLQNYGCAAEELGDILKGQNDGAFFIGPHLWDVAAGFLMIEEAGGKTRCELKNPDDPRGGVIAVASTKEIFKPLHDFVFGPGAINA